MAAPATTSSSTAPPASPSTETQSFDTALRGYERRQVDEFISRNTREVGRLRRELSEAQRQRRLATEHAEATETELRELRARSVHGEPAAVEDSFGYRAEKLLRMAEQEASEARSHATRESAAIIEQARTDAEKHRHEVEQSLISRASLLEQQAAQRTAELQEREQQIAEQLAAAREQADQLHATSARAADRLRQESEAAAEETRVRAQAAAQRQLDQAGQEIGRLNGLQSDVRAELARLAELLASELSGARRGTQAPRAGRAAETPEDQVTTSSGRATNGGRAAR